MLIYLQIIETEQERSKFEQIYTDYYGLMYHVAHEILQNHHDTEDAIHQAVLSIIENIKKIAAVRCPETRSYIVIITEHKAIDILRSKRRFVDADFDETFYGVHVPLPGDHGLADAMAKLPARYRGILLLHFDNGYSTKELAQSYKMTQSSVQKLLWRAKAALRKIYEGDDQQT